MRSVADNDVLNRIEQLVGELRLIERWDADYWQNRLPEAYESFAFMARRTWRTEILSQLLTLVKRLDIRSRGLHGLSRKSTQRTKERTTASGGSNGNPTRANANETY
jgi:hypothetical protein